MSTAFRFPVEFCSADAIQRALYRVADEGSWDVARDGDSWVVTIKPKSPDNLEKLQTTFKQHVVDYGLREKIRKETEHTRALLLAHAFSAASQSK